MSRKHEVEIYKQCEEKWERQRVKVEKANAYLGYGAHIRLPGSESSIFIIAPTMKLLHEAGLGVGMNIDEYLCKGVAVMSSNKVCFAEEWPREENNV